MYSIYKITNRDTGRTYIGMTEKPVEFRFRKHIRGLRAGEHVNDHMQADWNLGHSFVVVKLASRKHKDVAKRLETQLMNLEDNPYNIAMGNPGDMVGYQAHRFTDENRPYMYAEINRMRQEKSADVRKRFNISAPMVSMIQTGMRTAPEPQTSFADVFFCDQTQVRVENPPASGFLRLYREYA